MPEDTITKCVQAEIRKYMHDTQSKYHEVLTKQHEDLGVPYPRIITEALLKGGISDKELERY